MTDATPASLCRHLGTQHPILQAGAGEPDDLPHAGDLVRRLGELADTMEAHR